MLPTEKLQLKATFVVYLSSLVCDLDCPSHSLPPTRQDAIISPRRLCLATSCFGWGNGKDTRALGLPLQVFAGPDVCSI